MNAIVAIENRVPKRPRALVEAIRITRFRRFPVRLSTADRALSGASLRPHADGRTLAGNAVHLLANDQRGASHPSRNPIEATGCVVGFRGRIAVAGATKSLAGTAGVRMRTVACRRRRLEVVASTMASRSSLRVSNSVSRFGRAEEINCHAHF